jgi:hypothetical protein
VTSAPPTTADPANVNAPIAVSFLRVRMLDVLRVRGAAVPALLAPCATRC